jgi:hypothetical protein
VRSVSAHAHAQLGWMAEGREHLLGNVAGVELLPVPPFGHTIT